MIRDMLRRLGVEGAPATDLDGLRQVYAAWCAQVPFDNVRKMIWLRRKADEPLPGTGAAHFFEGFLEDGAGGTCWPSANGLHELLAGLGFQVERITGSMREMGFVNHGSVLAAVNGTRQLVDTSMLNGVPLEFGSGTVEQDHPVFDVAVRPDNDTYLAHMQSPPWPDRMPCRFWTDAVPHGYFTEKYEASRAMSPFNQRVYARRNRGEEMVVVFGNTRFVKSAEGVTAQVLTADELCETLQRDIGLSPRLVAEWVDSGSLADSMVPVEARG